MAYSQGLTRETAQRGERRMVRSAGQRQGPAGNEALIRSLFAEHGRALLAYVTRLTEDRSLAEDIVQETILRAWRNPDVMVNGKGSVRGWLLTVARNIVIDQSRARAARPTEVPEVPYKPPVARDHADNVVNQMVVMEALEQLPPEHRDVLVQIYLKGRTIKEAAEALGVPVGTVKSRTFYALRTLRDGFGGRDLGMVTR
ncbi:RNA polymerase sigma factor, sigma-70 family [Cryptosporangium arvum DSM 44712]|uniref:RNA polymerase sigma factor, sigma-70 family n=2 Tax=Cryptosporangium TaxID=65502 RepID=A0A010ZWA3_9ACTN|nr:RNA polymerase sigma factor, sigma-70 family [Cryptosporangium arvum DSM 44712]